MIAKYIFFSASSFEIKFKKNMKIGLNITNNNTNVLCIHSICIVHSIMYMHMK